MKYLNHFKLRHLLFLMAGAGWLMPRVAWARDIGETCKQSSLRQASALARINKPTDLGVSHQHLKDHGHPEVRAMYKGLEAFAKRLEAVNEEDWRENKQVRTYLENISERLNSGMHDSLATAPSNRLAQKMKRVVQRYPTAQSRVDKGDEYYKELEEALALTDVGQEVLKCYQSDARHPLLVKGPMGRLIVGAELSSNEKMSLDMVPAQTTEDESKQYATFLRFDFNEDPVGALLGLAHELSHGCDFSQQMPELTVAAHQVRRVGQSFRHQMGEYVMTQKMLEHVEEKSADLDRTQTGKFVKGQQEGNRSPAAVEIRNFKKALEESRDKMEVIAKEYILARREYDQLRAISELRAYRQSTLVARELAEAFPDLVCRTHTVSLMYGPRVATWAEVQAELEEQLRQGTFLEYMVADYVSSKHYEGDSFYDQKDGKVIEPVHLTANFVKRLGSHRLPEVTFSSPAAAPTATSTSSSSASAPK